MSIMTQCSSHDQCEARLSKQAAVILATIVILAIIFLILAAISLYATWEGWKMDFVRSFRTDYAKSVYETCRDAVSLGPQLEFPKDALDSKAYHPELAAYLFQAAIQTTRDSCRREDYEIPLPRSFTQYQHLRAINPYDQKERPVATAYWSVASEGEMDCLLLSFNGTKFLDQWITDLKFRQLSMDQTNNYLPGMLAHKGFYQSYLSIRAQVLELMQYSPRHYLITGHSLGGATSTIAALDTASWNPIHYSFASPRVGNPAFASQYQALVPDGYRVCNLSDTIPELPLPVIGKIDYQHVLPLVYFDQNLGSIPANHIQAYLNNLILDPQMQSC